MINICCTQYKNGGCLHPAAPTKMFSRPDCIEAFPPNDPRIFSKCKIKVPYPKPEPPPRAL